MKSGYNLSLEVFQVHLALDSTAKLLRDITTRLEDCVRVNCKLAITMIKQLVDLVMAW
jgi:hypothetical protein